MQIKNFCCVIKLFNSTTLLFKSYYEYFYAQYKKV